MPGSGFQPLSAAFVFVGGASFGSEHQSASKTADSHELSKKLLRQPNVVFAHPLLGEQNLLTLVTGANAEDVLKVIDEQVLCFQNDTHDYVTTTHENYVRSISDKTVDKSVFDTDAAMPAWILLQIGVAGSEYHIMRLRERYSEIKFVATTSGQYKAFLFVETENIRQLGRLVDTVRQSRFVSDTTTLPVSPEG